VFTVPLLPNLSVRYLASPSREKAALIQHSQDKRNKWLQPEIGRKIPGWLVDLRLGDWLALEVEAVPGNYDERCRTKLLLIPACHGRADEIV
jgi:hypothetical protein